MDRATSIAGERIWPTGEEIAAKRLEKLRPALDRWLETNKFDYDEVTDFIDTGYVQFWPGRWNHAPLEFSDSPPLISVRGPWHGSRSVNYVPPKPVEYRIALEGREPPFERIIGDLEHGCPLNARFIYSLDPGLGYTEVYLSPEDATLLRNWAAAYYLAEPLSQDFEDEPEYLIP